jgi:hypothetical protein|tara:strand:+ start:5313 stop:5576 length:264 start_codon:yes stop_codon:yes gene_type:complete
MSDTESSTPTEPEPEPSVSEPVVAPLPIKKKREGVKMTEKQKADLTKQVNKVCKDMTVSEKKSYRMKMMSQMRKGNSIAKAHKAVKV